MRNLETLAAGAELADIAAGRTSRCVLPWIVLMHGGDRPETIAEWKRLASEEPEAEKRRLYAGLALVFAERVDRRALWQRELKEWEMERSQIVMEWEGVGELRATRKNLLRVLRARWPQAVPEALVRTIEAETRLAVLEAWLDRAATVATPDAVTDTPSPAGS